MGLNAIYIPEVGRPVPRCIRASGFLEKTQGASLQNLRAKADCAAEKLMPLVNLSFDSQWRYIGSLDINDRPFHYYQKTVGTEIEHLWVTAVEFDG